MFFILRKSCLTEDITNPSRHECISDASLRRLTQRLTDVSNRGWFANLWDVSHEIDQRRLLRDVSEMSHVFSETSLSCIWDCNFLPSNWRVISLNLWLPTPYVGSCLKHFSKVPQRADRRLIWAIKLVGLFI